ncbi:transposase [Streptomyces sp. NPDC092903]|uniref:transposase n=1 Tax=Streptomyces sp. NPDC092903 TaxID=3366017 RepID=UPI0038272AC8
MRGRPAVGRRRLIDGIRWRVRTGAPWRDLPSEYGPWQTVYGHFAAGSVTASGPHC